MKEALKEARKALEEGEVPIGAVVVKDEKIIGRGHNRKENLNDPTAHAEIIAITAASNSTGDWRLKGAVLYTTIEPCLMCTGAVIQARIEKVIFGARDEKFGSLGSVMNVKNGDWNWDFEIIEGIMAEESGKILKTFFEERRDG